MNKFFELYTASRECLGVRLVTVQADVSNGLLQWHIVGLPDAAMRESKQRIASAFKNSGVRYPDKKVTVNLSPADMKKEGASFDLAIALCMLVAAGIIKIPQFIVDNGIFLGEVGLDGNLQQIKYTIIFAGSIKGYSKKILILPKDNEIEALLIEDIIVFAPKNLQEIIHWFSSDDPLKFASKRSDREYENLICNDGFHDFSEVIGCGEAKRAMQIAVAGWHHALLIGSPGSGKTMIAERARGLLPPLHGMEKLEITKIYSIKIQGGKIFSLLSKPPYCAPHHTVSSAGLVGGGSIPHPGAITMAHKGILFLDEFLEIHKKIINCLREPLTSKQITILRTAGEETFPADFLLIAAANPCPCGYYGDINRDCACSMYDLKRYMDKLSGPIIDRIDLYVPFSTNDDFDENDVAATDTKTLYAGVLEARERQKKRYRGKEGFYNGHLSNSDIKEYCSFSRAAEDALDSLIKKKIVSIRSYYKIMRISQTIADIHRHEIIEYDDVLDALNFQSPDRHFL